MNTKIAASHYDIMGILDESMVMRVGQNLLYLVGVLARTNDFNEIPAFRYSMEQLAKLLSLSDNLTVLVIQVQDYGRWTAPYF